jgi:glycosyltransferase involved in cell wall biosynthesis
MTDTPRRRLCVFSRYQLSEQFDLAAEFRPMLERLAAHHDVLHLSFRNSRPPADIPDGVELAEIPLDVDRNRPRDVIIKSLLMYALLPLAAWKIRRHKPDLVFVSEILPLAGLFFRWTCGCRVATAYGDWHVHNFLGRKWWITPFLRLAEWLERFEARRLEGLFCRAAAAGHRLAAWGVAEENIRVVFDAPDLAAFYPQDQSALRARCGFAPEDVVLLYHGVMHQGKGLDLLLRCTADLYRADPRIGLIMVGSGPELEPLKTLARELGIAERVWFTGWLKTIHEVGHYCNAADICIAMRTGAESNIHIIPGALLHSMACRKVVIGPDLSGIREVIRPGENGHVFAADDANAFTALIRQLAADRAAWTPLAAAAEADIHERFSVDGAARRYAAALEHFATVEKRG